jgi:hypothetical protein
VAAGAEPLAANRTELPELAAVSPNWVTDRSNISTPCSPMPGWAWTRADPHRLHSICIIQSCKLFVHPFGTTDRTCMSAVSCFLPQMCVYRCSLLVVLADVVLPIRMLCCGARVAL